jgi:hypothetical protein
MLEGKIAASPALLLLNANRQNSPKFVDENQLRKFLPSRTALS